MLLYSESLPNTAMKQKMIQIGNDWFPWIFDEKIYILSTKYVQKPKFLLFIHNFDFLFLTKILSFTTVLSLIQNFDFDHYFEIYP